jgi:hypothetical protein
MGGLMIERCVEFFGAAEEFARRQHDTVSIRTIEGCDPPNSIVGGLGMLAMIRSADSIGSC